MRLHALGCQRRRAGQSLWGLGKAEVWLFWCSSSKRADQLLLLWRWVLSPHCRCMLWQSQSAAPTGRAGVEGAQLACLPCRRQLNGALTSVQYQAGWYGRDIN